MTDGFWITLCLVVIFSMLSSWNVLTSTTSLLSFHFMIILFLAECCYCFPLLVLPSSQNLETLFYWSSWFQQHLFFWYIRCQQDLDWCTSCPGKDSSPYQVGRGLPPAQSSKKSFPLGVSGHKWYPYHCILWSSKHSLCCFHRVCRFSIQTCYTLMACTESNRHPFQWGRHSLTQMLRSGVYTEENLNFRVSRIGWIL